MGEQYRPVHTPLRSIPGDRRPAYKGDGTLYAEGDKIAIVNNGIMALFGDARYKINGMTVESVDNNVGIATTVMGLARMSDDYAKTAGTNFMWAKDTSQAAETDPAAADYNLGFAIRQKLLHSDDGTANSPRSSPSVTSLDSPETSGKSSTG